MNINVTKYFKNYRFLQHNDLQAITGNTFTDVPTLRYL